MAEMYPDASWRRLFASKLKIIAEGAQASAPAAAAEIRSGSTTGALGAMRTHWLLAGVSAVALCVCVAPVAARAAEAPAASAAARPAGGDTQVGEVVVTAQRREENVQKVPIAISVVGADLAASMGVNSTADLQTLVPGLQFGAAYQEVDPVMRGVATNPTITLGDEAAIAVYIDDVYMMDPGAGLFKFNNISQIAVLKGPQGTLFGRNAVGGVIQVTTKTPTMDPHADFSLGYGNYNTVTTDFYGAAGIVPGKLAADISVHFDNQADGWGKNHATGADVFKFRDLGVRSKWVWTPDSLTDVTLALDYMESYSQYVAQGPFDGPGFPLSDGVTTNAIGFYDVNANYPNPRDTERVYGASVKIKRDLGWANFLSISAYRYVRSTDFADIDATPLNLLNYTELGRSNTFSQEFQLQSPSGATFLGMPIQWIGGLYYLHSNAEFDPAGINGILIGPAPLLIYNTQTTKSYSVFGQETTTLAPGTRLTVGLRYTEDNQREDGLEMIPGLGALVTSHQRAKYPKMTYKVSLDHDFADNLMGYVSASRGFKSGVFNLLAPGDPPVAPEVLDAYEVGVKSQLFDRRLQLNASAYYYKFSNLQYTSVLPSGLDVLQNAASSESKGVDVDFVAKPVERLTLRGGVNYVDAYFTSFPNATLFSHNPRGGDNTFSGSATGNSMIQSPKWSFNIAGDYSIPTSVGDFLLDVNYYWTGKQYWNPDNLIVENPYDLLSASVTWRSPSRKWDVQVWGRNLTASKYHAFGQSTAFGDIEIPGSPLTFGATLGVHFP